MIELASGMQTDRGQRPTNEDRCASRVPDAALLSRKGALYALADGLGGYEGGELASEAAIRTLVEQYYSPLSHPRIEPSLQRAVQAANLAVFDLAESEARYRSMATTLDALVLTSSSAYLAHVGDGRVYRMRDGRVRRMTEDHSEVAQLVRMRLVAADRLRDHPRRNVLTRTVGSALIVRPDFARDPISPGDRFLMCSDGLWGALDEREIEEVMREESPERTAATLVELALTHGADDNVTVQIVDVRAVSGDDETAGNDASPGVLRRLARRFVG